MTHVVGQRVKHKRRCLPKPDRTCHFCGGLIPDDEEAVQAKTENAWAHFECWYSGIPFERDPRTGKRVKRFLLPPVPLQTESREMP